MTTQHEKHTEKEEQLEATIPMIVNGIWIQNTIREAHIKIEDMEKDYGVVWSSFCPFNGYQNIRGTAKFINDSWHGERTTRSNLVKLDFNFFLLSCLFIL